MGSEPLSVGALTTSDPAITTWPPALPAEVDGFELRARVHEGRSWIYQARRAGGTVVALKLAPSAAGRALHCEAQTLTHSAGAPVPSPLARGSAGTCEYLAISWLRGVRTDVAAAELRAARARGALLELCTSVLRAYSALHERGVIHGQVHPRHILADGHWRAGVVDFSGRRAPLGMLSSPEEADSWRRGESHPLTAESEQYSLAALLYLIVTGRLYASFGRERVIVAEQILTAEPLPFARRDTEPWPKLERLLAKALGKDPADRFASLTEFADALGALSSGIRGRIRRPRPSLVAPPLAAALEQVRAQTGFAGPLLPGGLAIEPTFSITYGAAGIAFALCRLGRDGRDAAALEEASAWLEVADRDRARASRSPPGDEVRSAVGVVSPFHSAGGIELVRALLARASGDRAVQQAAIGAYLSCADAPCANLDLTQGLSGVLLGCALLRDQAPSEWPATARLQAFGDELRDRIWAPPVALEPAYQGIAHGWAGVVYATLAWARISGTHPPTAARAVLDGLADASEPWGRGARWATLTGAPGGRARYWPGWCHGSAGHTFLWTLAHDVYGGDEFAELAERAAWSTWDAPPRGIGSLCCGTAGAVYALLGLYRHTEEAAWLDRAARLANQAADAHALGDDSRRPLSLYRGRLGLALLAAELREPERSAMPMFEAEP